MQHQSAAHAGEDQPNFTARNHSHADHQAVHPAFQDAQAANLLSDDGGQGNEGREAKYSGRSETAQVHAQPHQNKEDRHDERIDGIEQLLHAPFAAHGEGPVMNFFKHHAGGEGAHDGG